VNSYVTDTQALIKFMMGQKVIDDKCHEAFRSADRGEGVIIIPAVVLMEVLYLSEKNRITIDLLQTEDLLKCSNYQFEPLSLEILKAASEIDDIPELHDRLIAATARYLDTPIITNDPVIRESRFVQILTQGQRPDKAEL
jgi:predicted nucleic acid-binding protein